MVEDLAEGRRNDADTAFEYFMTVSVVCVEIEAENEACRGWCLRNNEKFNRVSTFSGRNALVTRSRRSRHSRLHVHRSLRRKTM